MSIQKNRNIHLILLYCFLFLNSQFLFDIAHNPLAIPYLQEAYLGFLLFFFIAVTIPSTLIRFRIPKLDAIVAAIVIVVWLGSAIHAYLRYGQPIWYGLIEDRRMLGLLAYFPLVTLLRAQCVNTADVFRCILALASIFIVYGILVRVGVAPTFIPLDLDETKLRAGRMNIGLYYMIFAFFICLSRMAYRVERIWIGFAFFFFFSLIAIGQTRQLIFGAFLIGLSAFFIGKKRLTKRLVWIIAIGGAAIFLGSWLGQDILQRYFLMFSALSTEEYLDESARILTILTIVSELTKGDLLGHGALSLLWQGGFHRLYGEFFYLADVGVVGTIFRFGILGFPLLLFIGWALVWAVRRLPMGETRRIIGYGLAFSFLLMPTAGLVIYRGFFVGILLAVSATYAESPIQEVRKIRNRNRIRLIPRANNSQ